MATIETHQRRLRTALRQSGQYSEALYYQVKNLARTLASLDKCDELIASPEFSPVITKKTRDGAQEIEHPIFKVQDRLQQQVNRQMKQLGLTTENIVGKPDIPNGIDEMRDIVMGDKG